ncbi:hypothetical protein Hanom_Chr11g01053841 [Helianthus anomalus]
MFHKHFKVLLTSNISPPRLPCQPARNHQQRLPYSRFSYLISRVKIKQNFAPMWSINDKLLTQ